MGNEVAIHQKNDRQCLESYCPVSLLPICGKIVLIINETFPIFIKNGVSSQNQTGFKPGDSCVNQLLSTTHELCKSFDDARSVFLDISKASNKVWREVIIFKFGISGELLNRIVLNKKYSNRTNINAGIPKGSILGPALFCYT